MITHTVLSVTFDIQQKDRVLEFLHFETVKCFQFTVGAALKKSHCKSYRKHWFKIWPFCHLK